MSNTREQCYLAVDCGAESGRVIAGLWDGSRLRLEEVHRFPTGILRVEGTMRWEIERIWSEIERGLGIAAMHYGDSIVSVGVDTWGLDYVLLDKAGNLIEQPWNYRDTRTRGLLEKVKERVSHEAIFDASGVQFMEINTLYQLLAANERDPALLASAHRMLMIPDYLHFKLCGAQVGEFTNATTTQFFHPVDKTWSFDLLEKLGLPTAMLPQVVEPGTPLGRVLPEVRKRTGLHPGVKVIAPATHDTGSAVAGVPLSESNGRGRSAYMSSGTWSLLGLELSRPNVSARAFKLNLTNEGGVGDTYRLLKNIMGLWIVQGCRSSFERQARLSDYAALVEAARCAPAFRSLIDPDAPGFLNPADMVHEIAQFCRQTGQPVPRNEGEFIRCSIESLALKYAVVLGWLEETTTSPVDKIHVVGGGARNELLNSFTASATGREVIAGPIEATAVGNVLVQAIASRCVESLREGREIVRASYPIRTFSPLQTDDWLQAADRFASILAER
ncbi:MAG: rhamnulokinase family protein [Verrucomicrobiota bacterium]